MSHNVTEREPVRRRPAGPAERPRARRHPPPHRPQLTRRRFLRRLIDAGTLAALGAATYGVDELLHGGSSAPTLHAFRPTTHGATLSFRSRGDLRPPVVEVQGAETAAGYLLLGPGSQADNTEQGPMLVDATGQLVWFRPLPHGLWASNLGAGSYGGRRVLSWWEGKVVPPGFGQGEGVIVDHSYQEVKRIRPANGRQMDLHAFHLTPEGTAVFTCFPETVPADLSSVNGPADGQVSESIFQEIDVRTGRLLLEWRSLDHIPVTDSYKPVGAPYDYLHLNSIQILPDGNFLISGRHTWSLYKLERGTGRVIWKLGGKRSDFNMGPGAQFAWQHDARSISDTRFTVFDNESDGPNTNLPQSRGLILDVDSARRSVTLHRAFQHPQKLLATAMGNVQVLPNGRVLIGWGTASHTTEFTTDGRLISDAQLPPNMYSYRVYRSAWRGTPADPPAVAAQRDARTGKSTIYVSWNGSTEVTGWQVHAGHRRRHLTTLGVAPRQGFETAIPVGRHRYVAVSALDRFGRRLARSATLRA